MPHSAFCTSVFCLCVIVSATGLSHALVLAEKGKESSPGMVCLNTLPNATTKLINKETRSTQTRSVKVGEDGMRKSASKVVMPVYPKMSIKKRKSGVGVAEVEFDGEGNVVRVTVLESPDAECAKSISSALKQWKFTPSKLDGEPVYMRGKLTFYFVSDSKGRGEVRPPKQFS